MSTEQAISAGAGHPEELLLPALPAELSRRIESFVYHRDYEARQIIYFPDDACDFVYWVRSGHVRITRVLPDGRELTFRHVVTGELFGEETVLPRPRRTDYAEALTPATLALLRAEDFRRFLREEPAFTEYMATLLCRRALKTEDVLVETVYCSVRQRVALGLLRLCGDDPPAGPVEVPITHQELANLIGSTRETTTAVLHQLRAEGLVLMSNRRLTIQDCAALALAARSA